MRSCRVDSTAGRFSGRTAQPNRICPCRGLYPGPPPRAPGRTAWRAGLSRPAMCALDLLPCPSVSGLFAGSRTDELGQLPLPRFQVSVVSLCHHRGRQWFAGVEEGCDVRACHGQQGGTVRGSQSDVDAWGVAAPGWWGRDSSFVPSRATRPILTMPSFCARCRDRRNRWARALRWLRRNQAIERKSGAWSAARNRKATSSTHLRWIAREERTPVV